MRRGALIPQARKADGGAPRLAFMGPSSFGMLRLCVLAHMLLPPAAASAGGLASLVCRRIGNGAYGGRAESSASSNSCGATPNQSSPTASSAPPHTPGRLCQSWAAPRSVPNAVVLAAARSCRCELPAASIYIRVYMYGRWKTERELLARFLAPPAPHSSLVIRNGRRLRQPCVRSRRRGAVAALLGTRGQRSALRRGSVLALQPDGARDQGRRGVRDREGLL